MSSKPTRFWILASTVAMAASLVAAPAPSAQALSGSDFNAGYIISDALFYDANAMSEAEIQQFLEAKIGGCLNSLCLNVLRMNTTSRTADRTVCGAYSGQANERASAIIFKVQQACSISAKVLLVTLQKEQGLVTHPSPSESRLERAMGYGCPDSTGGTCDSKYYGFYNQVYSAAWQMKRYSTPDQWGAYQPGWRSIRFNPSVSCGASDVYIQNNATAALYNYTPYQPNAAALANLGRTGDGCSSYGNRNFWDYFNTWFGSSIGHVNPVGTVDFVQAVPGQVRVAGWVFDPDSKDPTSVAIYVNGLGRMFTASNSRPDLPPIYGDIGEAHGYDVRIPVESPGPQEVCVYGINQGPGTNVQIGGGCRTVTALSGSPVGIVDSVTAAAGIISTNGWVLDPDTTNSTPVHIYIDANGLAYTADQDRPDIAAAYPGYGAAHGYSASAKASPGAHTVCVYGINVGPGSNSLRGCKSVFVATGAPYGVLDSVQVTPGKITISGWTFDPDSTESIPVHIYVDSVGSAFTADKDRLDVAAVYPGYGTAHGFIETISATAGTHTVCAYGIEIAGPGSNKSLGCKVVTVMSGSPIGVVDSITAAGGKISVVGWALDPDTADSINIRIAVDSVEKTYSANKSRPDIAAAYPAYGSLHGYSETLEAGPGTHTVCVYAVNTGAGEDILRGCKNVTL